MTNNLDELNRIYRNNTLWEIGESLDSRVSKSPPKRHPMVRVSRLHQKSPGTPGSPNYKNYGLDNQSLRLDSIDPSSPESPKEETKLSEPSMSRSPNRKTKF